jgi:aspartokinase
MSKLPPRKVLKFGGTCLANGKGLERALEIIRQKHQEGPVVVLSAGEKASDQLQDLSGPDAIFQDRFRIVPKGKVLC